MTIKEIVRSITDALASYSDAPNVDAQRMTLAVLGEKEPIYLIAHSNDILSGPQIAAIQEMQQKRITGMPLAYILGEADFYGRTFMVTPDVLIPRPETESLVQKALEYIQTNFSDTKEITIADIGTGSGCIAITLALEMKRPCRMIATDISPAALRIAKQNAERHGVLNRIEFYEGNMLEPIADIHVDLTVSNPPYVPTKEMIEAGNKQEARGLLFEPQIALDGGVDGLDFVRQIEQSKIPAIVETIGGEICEMNI